MSASSTIFLLPGLLCDDAVWEHQKMALENHAEVIVPIFRGYDSLVAMAESVLAQAPERFSVVGHSMGGRVAMELMHLAGNRIDKFVLMDTGAHPVQPGEQEKRQVLLDLADNDGLQAVADAWMFPMIHPQRHTDEALIQSINEMILRSSVSDFKGQIKALLSRNDHSLYLPEIKQQVLLICGDEDSWSPVSQHQEMMKSLDRAELKVVKNSGHMSTMEKPLEVTNMLLDWFANNAS